MFKFNGFLFSKVVYVLPRIQNKKVVLPVRTLANEEDKSIHNQHPSHLFSHAIGLKIERGIFPAKRSSVKNNNDPRIEAAVIQKRYNKQQNCEHLVVYIISKTDRTTSVSQ